jgi:hypothetical protein
MNNFLDHYRKTVKRLSLKLHTELRFLGNIRSNSEYHTNYKVMSNSLLNVTALKLV